MAKLVWRILYHIVLCPLLREVGMFLGPLCSIAVTVEKSFSFRGNGSALVSLGFSVDSKLHCWLSAGYTVCVLVNGSVFSL